MNLEPVFFSDNPPYKHVVHRESMKIPKNTRLLAEYGEVKVYAMEQRPDVLVKVWLRRNNDV